MSVQIKSVVRPTQIVRGVMYSHGRAMVFTNKYPTCRTVKCYFGPHELAEEISKDVTAALHAAGVKEFKIKTRKAPANYWLLYMNSLIVRIPFSEQAQ